MHDLLNGEVGHEMPEAPYDVNLGVMFPLSKSPGYSQELSFVR